jgi:ribosome biogenesis GTPase
MSGRLKQFLYSSQRYAAVGDMLPVDVAIVFPINELKKYCHQECSYSVRDRKLSKRNHPGCYIDQVIITSSWLKPRLKAGLIDRYLCIVALQGLQPIIVINKIDLLDDEQEQESQTAYYKAWATLYCILQWFSGTGMNELKELLVNKDSSLLVTQELEKLL